MKKHNPDLVELQSYCKGQKDERERIIRILKEELVLCKNKDCGAAHCKSIKKKINNFKYMREEGK